MPPSSRTTLAAAIGLLVVSWALLIVGWSLPWEHYLDSPADTTSGFEIDPWDTGSSLGDWLRFWLVVSIFAVVAGIALYAVTRREAWTLAVVAAPTVAWGLIALYMSVYERNLASDRSSPDYVLRANGGVYVAIAGSAMLLISGLLMVVAAVRRRDARRPRA